MIDFLASDGPNFSQQYLDFLEKSGLTPGALIDAVTAESVKFGAKMAEYGVRLLAATWTVRFLVVTFKELLDGDFIELISEWIGLAVMGVFLTVFLSTWGSGGSAYSIPGIAEWFLNSIAAVAGDAASVSGADGSGVLEGVFGSIISSGTDVLGAIWDAIAESARRMKDAFSVSDIVIEQFSWFQGSAPSTILYFDFLNIILGIIASIAIAILICVLLYHAISGFIAFNVVVAFGPLTLAAYPLIDSWAKKAVSTFATAIVQMVAAIFILKVIGGLLEPFAQLAETSIK